MRHHCHDVLREQKISEASIKLIKGDIANNSSSVLVFSVDSQLNNTHPYTNELHSRAGPRVTYSLLNSHQSPLNLGQIIVTLAGNLPFNYIFHVCTAVQGFINPESIQRIFIIKCLEMCDEMNLGTISIPFVIDESSRLSPEQMMNLYFNVTQAYLTARPETILKEVKFIISEKDFHLFKVSDLIIPACDSFISIRKKSENQVDTDIELK